MKCRATNANAPRAGGVSVDRAGRRGATQAKPAAEQFITADVDLTDKCTSTEAQLVKLLALLRQGPKTTVDLRQHAIMMPAARVHQLRHEQNYIIRTELVNLYDPEGAWHRKCARYHLVERAANQGAS